MSIVVTRLIGGLGNQMFQYAAGRALAVRSGAALKLDVTELAAIASHSTRRYELGSFAIRGAFASEADLARFGSAIAAGSLRTQRLMRLLRLNWSNGARPVYRERHFHFDPVVKTLAAPICLEGFWQSERYFSDIADVIRQEFIAPVAMDSDNAALMAQIAARSAVSLHVRRGDYVSDPVTNRFHGVCSLDYYRRAVDFVAARIETPHLFIFSDDQEWTRANLRFPLPMTFVDVNSPDRGDQDMRLMARCQHHIVANSSFSWWGAWLNPSKEKIVVAPRRWFCASDNDTRDLIPESWVRL